ncbi:MAG: hypothetical protein IPN77_04375 [Sandaracinaceae bacterium]|nr:hypothetical protein [Sandaracinaceae bacterium]
MTLSMMDSSSSSSTFLDHFLGDRLLFGDRLGVGGGLCRYGLGGVFLGEGCARQGHRQHDQAQTG